MRGLVDLILSKRAAARSQRARKIRFFVDRVTAGGTLPDYKASAL